MGKNELGKVFNMARRSCLFFLSFGQSHFKHTKTILITEKNLLKNTIRNEKFGPDKQLWALVLNFNFIFSISSDCGWTEY